MSATTALILFFSLFAIEKNENLKVEHGEMRVVYKSADHKHYLKVLQKTDLKSPQGEPLYKQMQKLDLQLKDEEYLSIDKGFECYNKEGIYSYGIVTRKIAREKFPFPPLRAWLVIEKEFKLEPVENPYTIQCKFKKGEQEDYPFPPE